MIVARLSVVPIGEGASVSEYVKMALKALDESGVNFETNAMSTVIEASDFDTLIKAVKRAHNAVLKSGVKRVKTEVEIDERIDKEHTIYSKKKAVEKY